MKAALLAAVAALTSVPALAAPDQALYDQAVAARRSGDAASAAKMLEKYLADAPDSADALVQYGYSLLALDRLADADRAFAKALALAPDYADATIGRALVAERQGRTADARSLIAAIPAGNADADAVRARVNRQAPRSSWAADLDTTYSALGRHQPDWKEFDVQLRHQSADGLAIAARIEASERFDRHDTYGQLQVEKFFAGGSSLYVLGGATPDADYRPKWQVGGGGRWEARSGPGASILTLDLRHARYPTGHVTTVNPGIEQYVAGGNAWLTAQSINILSSGRLRTGFLARADVMANDRLRLFAGGSYAPDTSEGTVTRVWSAFGGAWVQLSPRLTVRAALARVEPRDGVGRTEFSIGTGVRF